MYVYIYIYIYYIGVGRLLGPARGGPREGPYEIVIIVYNYDCMMIMLQITYDT